MVKVLFGARCLLVAMLATLARFADRQSLRGTRRFGAPFSDLVRATFPTAEKELCGGSVVLYLPVQVGPWGCRQRFMPLC